MLSFLQPSQMENDQIYKLSLRPFYQRLIYVINTLEKMGEVSKEDSENLKNNLRNQEFLKKVYSPSLNYFVVDLTTYVSEGLGYNLDEAGLISKMQSLEYVQKFMSYFIIPCASSGVEIKTIISCTSERVIEISSLNYKLLITNKNMNYLVSTAKDTITFTGDDGTVEVVQIKNNLATILKSTDILSYTNDNGIIEVVHIDNNKANIDVQNDTLSLVDGIRFKFFDSLINRCLKDNIEVLNVRKNELKNNVIRNIDFTLNEHLYYKSCLKLIEEVWPKCYTEITSHIKLLAIMDTDVFGGFTSNLLPDAIFLSHHPNDFLWVTENIIHECAHSRLEQLLVVDPIVLNEYTEKFTSPWREDPRPMRGIYHGVFAFARVAMWLERLYDSFPEPSILHRLEVVRKQLDEGIEVISLSGKLSPIGKHVFDEILIFAGKKENDRTVRVSQ